MFNAQCIGYIVTRTVDCVPFCRTVRRSPVMWTWHRVMRWTRQFWPQLLVVVHRQTSEQRRSWLPDCQCRWRGRWSTSLGRSRRDRQTVETTCYVARPLWVTQRRDLSSPDSSHSQLVLKILQLHCVSKNDTDVAQYNFNAHQPILVIFDKDVAERVWYQTVICYPTSPN